jgi:hypothetical protein
LPSKGIRQGEGTLTSPQARSFAAPAPDAPHPEAASDRPREKFQWRVPPRNPLALALHGALPPAAQPGDRAAPALAAIASHAPAVSRRPIDANESLSGRRPASGPKAAADAGLDAADADARAPLAAALFAPAAWPDSASQVSVTAPVSLPAPPASTLDPLIDALGADVAFTPDGQAQISLSAGTAGDLSLYLRVRDGAAEVRVDGSAAALLDGRIPELRAALEHEGLALGSYGSHGSHGSHGSNDGGQGGDATHDRHRERPDADSDNAGGTPRAVPRAETAMKTPPDKTQSPRRKRRVHVTA